MAATGLRLTHTKVKNLAEPIRIGDGRGGNGLSILCKSRAGGGWSKTWSQRIRIDGRVRMIGLGAFPMVTLAEARVKAFDNARRVQAGENILAPEQVIPTLGEAFDAVISDKLPSWTGKRTESGWWRSRKYAAPICSKPISKVTVDDVKEVVQPLWHAKARTAGMVRSHLSAVMEWAIVRGYRTSNPATSKALESLGKLADSTHHPSLPYRDVGEALAKIRDADGWWAVRYGIVFLSLTGVRSGDVRGATWSEVNVDQSTWTIPAARVKGRRRDHRVPLSTQCVEILRYAKSRVGVCSPEQLVFPRERDTDVIRDSVFSDLFKSLQIPAVPHGSRSSFKDWSRESDPGEERSRVDDDVSEMALAHSQKGKVRAAYARSDLIDLRRLAMQRWADYVAETMGPVIALRDQV